MTANLIDSVPVLQVRDARRSVGFYCGKLGFQKEWEHRLGPDFPLFVSVSRGKVRLFLTERPEISLRASVYFSVDELENLVAEFAAAGVVPNFGPAGESCNTLELFVTDPDGNKLRFGQTIVRAEGATAGLASSARRAGTPHGSPGRESIGRLAAANDDPSTSVDRAMPVRQECCDRFPVRLSILQRRCIAGLTPEFHDRLKLEERTQRAIALTLAEWKLIQRTVSSALPRSAMDMKSRSLRQALDSIDLVIEEGGGMGWIPLSQRLYQFKITLQRTQPPIWRRIQMKNCTLDKLHEHIQTAMGWMNAHLHHFRIDGTRYGDPALLEENFDDLGYEDSTSKKIKEILPRSGKRFQFEYEYDFGDSWSHEILFEGCLKAEPGCRYPLCLEGERACPPEDIGGTSGFGDFLQALTGSDPEEHERILDWVGGRFDPDGFDALKATRRMRRGLPNWRLCDDFDQRRLS